MIYNNLPPKKDDIKVRVLFDRRKEATKTQPGSVEIELTTAGKRRRISTGVRVLSYQWSAGKVIRHPEAATLNALIEDKVAAVRVATGKGEDDARSVVPRRASVMSPADWLRNEIADRPMADTTRKHHEGMLAEIEASGLFMRWRDFTPRVLALWDARLRNVRGLTNQTTIYDYHKRLRVYLVKAVMMGLISANPYDKFKVSKGKQSDSIKYITDDERDRIAALEFEAGTGMAIARDMFLLACYTGLAYGDMIKVRQKDFVTEGDRVLLIDKRNKTGGRYRLTILPQALDILKQYGWNMNRLSNQKANMYLKGIGVAAGIATPLTMHMGRHTFATWALNNGVPIEIVSKMLAHSRIETTQIYAKVLQPEVDRGFDLLREAASKGHIESNKC